MRLLTKLTLFLSITGLFVSVSSLMADDAKTVIAVVNGTEITSAQIEGLAGINANVDFATLNDQQRTQIIVSLVNRQLVIEQARKEGFDRIDQIANTVNALAETYIAKQYMIKVAAETDLSEEVVMAYYKENYLDQPEQYELAHIVLASEDEANAVLELLNKGADFSNLARAKSQDRVSAEKGGDLGRLTPGDMMPSFYKSVSELHPGEISAQPTKSPFGWHIVKLKDKSESTPQPLNQVEQSIRQALIEKRMADYIKNLRDRATIEIR